MKCDALKTTNEGQNVECKVFMTEHCPKSRGKGKVTQYCWCIKMECEK